MRWNIIVECVGEYGKQSTIKASNCRQHCQNRFKYSATLEKPRLSCGPVLKSLQGGQVVRP
jgi:hypothetical protein